MNILAFAASNSKNSINKKLATFTANLIDGANVEILDLNDYELPLYSIDLEMESGFPEPAIAFLSKIVNSDAVIVSFAEHNGSYSAAFKNLFDWCSRIERRIFQNKPVLLLATSPGSRGGASVLEQAVNSLPRFGAEVKASLSVPNFNDNFSADKGIVNSDIHAQLVAAVGKLF